MLSMRTWRLLCGKRRGLQGFRFGHRACLALGVKTGLPVLTADRAWEACDVGVKIIRIR